MHSSVISPSAGDAESGFIKTLVPFSLEYLIQLKEETPSSHTVLTGTDAVHNWTQEFDLASKDQYWFLFNETLPGSKRQTYRRLSSLGMNIFMSHSFTHELNELQGEAFPLGLRWASIGNILATWHYPWLGLWTYQLLTMHLATCWQPGNTIYIKLNRVPALNNGNELLFLVTPG